MRRPLSCLVVVGLSGALGCLAAPEREVGVPQELRSIAAIGMDASGATTWESVYDYGSASQLWPDSIVKTGVDGVVAETKNTLNASGFPTQSIVEEEGEFAEGFEAVWDEDLHVQTYVVSYREDPRVHIDAAKHWEQTVTLDAGGLVRGFSYLGYTSDGDLELEGALFCSAADYTLKGFGVACSWEWYFTYGSDGELLTASEIEFDDQGHPSLLFEDTDGDGEYDKSSYYERVHDEEGRPVELSLFDEDGPRQKMELTYDADNLLETLTSHTGSNTDSSWNFQYKELYEWHPNPVGGSMKGMMSNRRVKRSGKAKDEYTLFDWSVEKLIKTQFDREDTLLETATYTQETVEL
ncbi:MAG: hypothetical protein VX519_01265 [Myxococcota bacterium]|nr:hypothetical protein [Myxococcota bacterium]